jgi:hypothetical protein
MPNQLIPINPDSFFEKFAEAGALSARAYDCARVPQKFLSDIANDSPTVSQRLFDEGELDIRMRTITQSAIDSAKAKWQYEFLSKSLRHNFVGRTITSPFNLSWGVYNRFTPRVGLTSIRYGQRQIYKIREPKEVVGKIIEIDPGSNTLAVEPSSYWTKLWGDQFLAKVMHNGKPMIELGFLTTDNK